MERAGFTRGGAKHAPWQSGEQSVLRAVLAGEVLPTRRKAAFDLGANRGIRIVVEESTEQDVRQGGVPHDGQRFAVGLVRLDARAPRFDLRLRGLAVDDHLRDDIDRRLFRFLGQPRRQLSFRRAAEADGVLGPKQPRLGAPVRSLRPVHRQGLRPFHQPIELALRIAGRLLGARGAVDGGDGVAGRGLGGGGAGSRRARLRSDHVSAYLTQFKSALQGRFGAVRGLTVWSVPLAGVAQDGIQRSPVSQFTWCKPSPVSPNRSNP